MRARSLLYMAALLLAIMNFSACGQQNQTPEAAQEQPTPAPAENSEALTAEIQSIHQSLRQAGWHAKRNNREAVPLFNDAASVLTDRAVTASNAVKEDLQFSASELTGLGERIFSGPPITTEELNRAQARAHWALAAYHQEQAAALWPDGAAQEIAIHLNASASSISAAVGYAGGPVRELGRELAKKVQELAQQVGNANDADTISQQIQQIGQEIRQLSNRVKQFLS